MGVAHPKLSGLVPSTGATRREVGLALDHLGQAIAAVVPVAGDSARRVASVLFSLVCPRLARDQAVRGADQSAGAVVWQFSFRVGLRC